MNDSDGNEPSSWAGPGSPQTQTGEEEGTGRKKTVQSAEDRPSQDEKWISMTTREKRRLWLHRRRSGEFYFRSEFKGLVHAVR